MATGFAPYCSKSQCSCKVANTLAVGLEAHAMCCKVPGITALARPPTSNLNRSHSHSLGYITIGPRTPSGSNSSQ